MCDSCLSGSGAIDQDELAFMLRSLGQNPTEDELQKLIHEFDDGERAAPSSRGPALNVAVPTLSWLPADVRHPVVEAALRCSLRCPLPAARCRHTLSRAARRQVTGTGRSSYENSSRCTRMAST